MGKNTPERNNYIMENLMVRWRSEDGSIRPTYSDCNRKNFGPTPAGTVTEIRAPLVAAGCATTDQEFGNVRLVVSRS